MPPGLGEHAQASRVGGRRLRLWPGVAILGLQWLFLLVPDWALPGTAFQFQAKLLSPVFGMTATLAWWLLGSRLRWADRLLIAGTCAATGLAAAFLSSLPIQVLIIFVLPWVPTAWVCWLLLTFPLRWPVRRAGLLLAFLLVGGYCTLLRFEGIDGVASATFRWRWSPTAEEKLLAEIAGRKASPAAAIPAAGPLALQAGDWPGFRGPARDGRLTGVRIATDWQEHPPRQLWRHRVGPGWSSFAVAGTHLFTQEQRGADEVVVCYDADSGAERWVHRDRARFSEVAAGPGPRATPTFHEGKVYALGTAGRLNCLDPVTGRPLWSRDIVADSGAKVPQWGFAASPLVAQDVVTVFAGGPEGKSMLGYRASSGEPAWSAGEGRLSYCSPQPARLGGVEQVLITTEAGLTSFDPGSGKVLWRHGWAVETIAPRVVQPALLDDTDVLIGTGFSGGTRRVRVAREGDGWAEKEVWTTRALKPFYNDMVVHRGHLYGFDGNILTCVSLEDRAGKWRARGYGNGQVLLLADQGLLLVLSEQGVVSLVEASPDGHRELGRFPAVEGKTWNHPVVAHGKLFVRNGEEAACYQLAEKSAGGEGGKDFRAVTRRAK
jgi:outer membrane protein assembly factor BamB